MTIPIDYSFKPTTMAGGELMPYLQSLGERGGFFPIRFSAFAAGPLATA
jgi:hypothetical protein